MHGEASHIRIPGASEVNARVVARMSNSQARVFVLAAPAGYGKTTAARRFVQQFERVAWCDCSDVTTVKEFVANLLAALAMDGGNDAAFTQARYETEVSSDDSHVLEILDRAWTAEAPTSAVVFDNCEQLASVAPLMDLLYRSIVTAGPNRRIIVCSRVPLRIRPGRYLPPHRMLRVTEADLRVTDDEARELLSGEVDDTTLRTIIERARGWPVVLLLLARLAHENRLESALEDSAGLEFDEFFEYFLNEVLAPLSDAQRLALGLCAALPDITENELVDALGGSTSEARAVLSSLPMVMEDGGRFTVHPMARSYVLSENARTHEVIAIAQAHERAGEFARAAQVYAHANDDDAVGRCLAALPARELLTPANLLQLARLPMNVFHRWPKLATGLFQVQSILLAPPGRVHQTLSLLESVFYHLEPGADPETVAMLAFTIAHGFWLLGLPDQWQRMVKAAQIERAIQSGNPLARMLLSYVREWHALTRGEVDSRVPVLQEFFSQAQAVQLVPALSPNAAALGWAFRWRGDRDASLTWVDRSVQTATQMQSPVNTMYALAYAVTIAWFWDGDEGAKRYDEPLEELGRKIGKRVNLALVDVDLLAGEIRAEDVLMLRNEGIELLLMRIAHSDPAQRPALFSKAESALTGTDVLTQVLFYIARAAAGGNLEADLRRARELSSTTQAHELTKAIDDTIARRGSFLDGFISRFKTRAAVRPSSLSLDLFQEHITVASNRFRVTAREAAFLTFLARQRIASPRDEIQEALWPDLDEQGARDALYSLIHRLRKRCAPADPIRNAGNAYAISDDAVVDLWEVEELAKDVQRGTPLPAEVVKAAYESVRSRSWPHLASYEWFSLLDFRVNECERALLKRLVESAEREQTYSEILHYANDAIESDPCDEWAYQMLMKAHMALGEEMEAARALRRYRETLQRELSAEPSEEMLALTRQSPS